MEKGIILRTSFGIIVNSNQKGAERSFIKGIWMKMSNILKPFLYIIPKKK